MILGDDEFAELDDDSDGEAQFAQWLETSFASWRQEREASRGLDLYVGSLVERLRSPRTCPSPLCETDAEDPVDPADDVVCVRTPGYYRDGQGRWRYEHNRRLVPGSRDSTIDGVYRPPCSSGLRTVPVVVVRTAQELSWCDRYPLDRTGHSELARLRSAHLVPCTHWRRRSRLPVGISAPELHPGRMLDTLRLAAVLGVSRTTITSYASRGYLPEPQSRVGGSALWALPVIDAWFSTRPGPGRPRSGTGPRTSGTRR